MNEKPSKLMPALYGGAIAGVISGIPFLSLINCLCCAGVMLGGVLAVFFYKKELPEGMPGLTSGDGVALGALAGVFSAIVTLVLTALFLFTIGNVAGEMVYNMVEGMFGDQMPPEALEGMRRDMETGGLSAMSVILTLIIHPVFGLLGGLIGAAIWKSKTPPAAPAA
jgi:hypothetical protein